MAEYKQIPEEHTGKVQEPAVAYGVSSSYGNMEVKRKELLREYNLPDDLIRLIGCIPPLSDEEREEAKEAYLREKYGLHRHP